MTPEQERHLQSIKDMFCSEVDVKYRRGEIKHGGDLFGKTTRNLLDSAIEEILDLAVYMMTLRQKAVGECHCHRSKNHGG